MKFMCGCDMPTQDRLLGDPNLTSLATVAYDEEGFLICIPHHERRQGWRSPSVGKFTGYSDLEFEKYVIFGQVKEPKVSAAQAPTMPDRRDNRDPEVIGNQLLAMGSRPSNYPPGQNGNGNGHVDRIAHPPGAGRKGMQYQRELALAQVISTGSVELARRETGF